MSNTPEVTPGKGLSDGRSTFHIADRTDVDCVAVGCPYFHIHCVIYGRHATVILENITKGSLNEVKKTAGCAQPKENLKSDKAKASERRAAAGLPSLDAKADP
jgi:hypothetical protein